MDVAGMADISVVTLAHARTRTYPAHQKSINKRVKCRCGHVRHFVALGGGGKGYMPCGSPSYRNSTAVANCWGTRNSFQPAIVASRLNLINCDIAPSAKILIALSRRDYYTEGPTSRRNRMVGCKRVPGSKITLIVG